MKVDLRITHQQSQTGPIWEAAAIRGIETASAECLCYLTQSYSGPNLDKLLLSGTRRAVLKAAALFGIDAAAIENMSREEGR